MVTTGERLMKVETQMKDVKEVVDKIDKKLDGLCINFAGKWVEKGVITLAVVGLTLILTLIGYILWGNKMKFKNTSGKTITVKYGDMITIKNGEVAELPLTYERPGLTKIEPVKIVKIKPVIKKEAKVEKIIEKPKKTLFKKSKKWINDLYNNF